jgi:hypothetical protein
MKHISAMRRAALLLFAGGGLAFAQSPALPATPPTAVPASSVPAAAAAAVPAQPVAHRAVVVFSGGQLEITADNSSLNQILRDVSRLTGMKITGGVADERVFGKYGPGAPAGILASLLEGTGSNMLLRESATHTPMELVLTPRAGGMAPPGPFASGSDEEAPASAVSPPQPDAPASPQSQAPAQPSAAQTQPATPQTQPAGGFAGAPVVTPANGTGAAPSSAPPSTGTTNPQSPNGVLTPQQVFQQLQQMQQQQPSSK